MVFSVMRQGLESLLPENEMTGLIEANRSKSILEASERLSQWAGRVEGALIRYEKVFLYAIRLQSEVLALSIDRKTDYERIAQIAKSILVDLQLE